MAPFPRLHAVEGHHGTLPLEALPPELLVLLLVALGRNSSGLNTAYCWSKKRGRTKPPSYGCWIMITIYHNEKKHQKTHLWGSLGKKTCFNPLGLGFEAYLDFPSSGDSCLYWDMLIINRPDFLGKHATRCPDLVQESAPSWAHLGGSTFVSLDHPGNCLFLDSAVI